MLKNVISGVLVVLIASIILSAFSLISPSKKDESETTAEDGTVAVTTVQNSPTDNQAPEGSPGCDEDLSGSEESPVTTAAATTAAPPQIDYGWPEEPGPS